MMEGHEADAWLSLAILAGVFNRLGDGKGTPLEIKEPAWLTAGKVTDAKSDLELARAEFQAFVGNQRRGG